MEAKVSVIIPVYNAEKYLRQCLDSVVSQSLRDIEMICVDDGSTDGSAEILREYADKDERIIILRQTNSGPAAARNSGLIKASGEYVMFLDADDWFEAQMLEKLRSAAASGKADIAICKAERFDALSGKPLFTERMLDVEALPSNPFSPEDIADKLFQLTCGQVWDKLYRTHFLKKNCLLYPPLRAAEDTAFVYEGLLLAGQICVVPEILVHYRVNRSGTVSNSFAKYPDAPYEAFRLIYEFMLERGYMERYKKSFLNWAAEYLIWQICNAPDEKTKKYLFSQFRAVWLPKLRLRECSADYLESRMAYIKLRMTSVLPYRLFSLVLKIYKGAK